MNSRAAMRLHRLSNKQLSLAWIVLAVAIIVLAFGPARALAEGYEMSHVGIEATVNPDGTIYVVEDRTFDFDEPFHNCYWDLSTSTSASELSDLSIQIESAGEVIEGSYQPYTESDSVRVGTSYIIEDRDSVVRVFLDTKKTEGRHTYRVVYTLDGAVARWRDVSELCWKFVADDLDESSNDVTCTIHLPAPENVTLTAGEEVRMWLRHAPLTGEVRAVDADIICTVPSVDRKHFAEVRAIFPESWLSDMERRPDFRRQTVLDEEGAWFDDANHRRNVSVLAYYLGIGGKVLALIGYVYLTVVAHDVFHERDGVFSGEYWRDVPSDHHPAVLESVLLDGRLPSSDAFAATLMSLSDRHILSARHVATHPKGEHFERDRSKDDIEFTLNPDWRSIVGVREEVSRDSSTLTTCPPGSLEIDAMTIDFLFDFIRSTACSFDGKERPEGCVRLSDVRLVELKINYSYRVRWKAWQKRVREIAREEGLVKSGILKSRVAFFVGALTLALPICLWVTAVANGIEEDRVNQMIWWVGAGMFARRVAIPILGLSLTQVISSNLTHEGLEIKARMEALNRWLRDFAALDEAVPSDVTRWNRLLEMSMVLGVSDEVARRLGESMPDVAEDARLSDAYAWCSSGTTGDSLGSRFSSVMSIVGDDV